VKRSELDRLSDLASRRFLEEHAGDDPSGLALGYHDRRDLPVRALAEQIACRQKARSKLPTLWRALLFEHTALEQCSSEATARYKASCMPGRRGVDLTTGLGIDAWARARAGADMTCCEMDDTLAALLDANSAALGLPPDRIRHEDAALYVQSLTDGAVDWVYLDPARRDASGRHVTLERCRPNVLALLPALLAAKVRVCAKASPLLEPREILRRVPHLYEWRFVPWNGQCRELLPFFRSTGAARSVGHAVVLNRDGSVLVDLPAQHQSSERRPTAVAVGRYLLEPDPAIIRAGAASAMAERESLSFVNATTDYLTADQVPERFAGSALRVHAVIPWRRRDVRTYLTARGIERATMRRRDFAASPEQMRSLLNLRDGGEQVLVCTRDRFGAPICIHGEPEDVAAVNLNS